MNDLVAILIENIWPLYTDPYSDVVFDKSGYTYIGIGMLASSLLCMLGFYYLWNPVFGRWYHWIVMLTASAVVAAGITYGILSEQLVDFSYNPEDYPNYDFYLFRMAGVTALNTFILAAIVSFIVRIGSSNNKANPFPLKFS